MQAVGEALSPNKPNQTLIEARATAPHTPTPGGD